MSATLGTANTTVTEVLPCGVDVIGPWPTDVGSATFGIVLVGRGSTNL